MKFYISILTIGLLGLLSTMSVAQKPFPVSGKVLVEDKKFNSLVASDASVEVLASGFVWSEGPVWVKEGGFLIFSDVPQNTIFRWHEKEGLSPFLKPSGYTGLGPYSAEPGSNGLTIDHLGRLIACEHGDRRVTAMPFLNGGKITLADRYQGKRFNSPNDVVQHRGNKSYYFTDPPYGLPAQEKCPTMEQPYFGVYRISPEGEVTLLIKDLIRPNGLAFSPDGKVLYVAQSYEERPIWMAYPVLENGNLGEGKVHFDAAPLVKSGLKGMPDGFKLDIHGNLWATGPGGVVVISPEGKLLGRIETGHLAANCAWGDDGSTLYITSHQYLCRIKTLTKGDGW